LYFKKAYLDDPIYTNLGIKPRLRDNKPVKLRQILSTIAQPKAREQDRDEAVESRSASFS